MSAAKEKTEKIVLCAIMAFGAFVGYSAAPSQAGLIGTLLAIAATSGWIVFGTSDDINEMFYLPECLIVVIGLGVFQRWESLAAAYQSDAVSILFQQLASGNQLLPWLQPLLLLAAAFFALGIFKKAYRSVGVVGAVVFSTCCLLAMYARYNGTMIEFEGTREIIVLHVVLSIALASSYFIAHSVDRDHVDTKFFLVVFAVILLADFSIAAPEYTVAASQEVCKSVFDLSSGGFAWWRIILVAAVLLFTCFALDGVGRFIYFASAFLLVIARLLISNYFVYGFLLLLALVWIAIVCFDHLIQEESIWGVHPPLFFLCSTLVIATVILAIARSLVPNVLVSVMLVLCLISTKNKRFLGGSFLRNVLFTIVALVVEAIAWQMTRGFSLGSFAMLVIVMALAGFSAIIAVGDSSRVAPTAHERLCCMVILCCVVLLCLASAKAPISIRQSDGGDNWDLTIEANDPENQIVAAEYIWKDYRGSKIKAGSFNFSDGKVSKSYTARSEILQIVAYDARGSRATRTYYFSPWTNSFKR